MKIVFNLGSFVCKVDKTLDQCEAKALHSFNPKALNLLHPQAAYLKNNLMMVQCNSTIGILRPLVLGIVFTFGFQYFHRTVCYCSSIRSFITIEAFSDIKIEENMGWTLFFV